jgi:5'-deoxynucleotidase YfbR-like HD superfamily hydrolase
MSSVIRTYTGRNVPLSYPTWRDIDIRDIARSHSLVNRFTGHTKRPYSVAEHVVVGSYLVAPAFALAFLLHDAHEAYIGDISSPLKRLLRGVADVSRQFDVAIGERFGLTLWPMGPEVHAVDALMLEAEFQVVMAKGDEEISGEVSYAQESALLSRARAFLKSPASVSPKHWEEAFLARFNELTTERELQRIAQSLQATPAVEEAK